MKKLLTFFLLFYSIIGFAFETNANFGIKQQSSTEGYRQYIGKQFFFREAYGQLETWYKSGFKYKDSYAGKIFTLTKISTKDVVLNGKPNKEISIQAVSFDGQSMVKFKGYEEVSVKYIEGSGVKSYPLIGCMPIVFTESFDEFKNKHIGETITNDIVKDQYEITNCYFGKGEGETYATSEINVYVKNKRTGEGLSCLYSKVNIAPFAEALDGYYKTALVKVEKPEDSTNRYGETKVITDEGVDKYSYTDSIIDILIYATKEQFNFVLKNISQHSLRLIWNEAAFVGLNGTSSKVMHSGIKYSQRENDQPASTIIKEAKLDDCATPTSNVYYDDGYTLGNKIYGNGWKTRSMFPEEYIGKEIGEIKLMLPIQIKDVINEYTFVFKVYYTFLHPELLKADKI